MPIVAVLASAAGPPPPRCGVYDLDFPSVEVVNREKCAVWHSSLAWLIHRIEHFNLHQVGLLVAAIVAIGFYCMRGFGSRSNY
jgi:hypothetical protein